MDEVLPLHAEGWRICRRRVRPYTKPWIDAISRKATERFENVGHGVHHSGTPWSDFLENRQDTRQDRQRRYDLPWPAALSTILAIAEIQDVRDDKRYGERAGRHVETISSMLPKRCVIG